MLAIHRPTGMGSGRRRRWSLKVDVIGEAERRGKGHGSAIGPFAGQEAFRGEQLAAVGTAHLRTLLRDVAGRDFAARVNLEIEHHPPDQHVVGSQKGRRIGAE